MTAQSINNILNIWSVQMRKTQTGLTLIELMIVIAILGILAAIAIPAYQDYAIRAKISEGIAAAAPAKTSIAEYYQDRGGFPVYRTSAGFPGATSKYVTLVTLTAGNAMSGQPAIIVDINEGTTGAPVAVNICLDPYATAAGGTDWDCFVGTDATCTAVATDAQTRLVPSECRTQAAP